MRILRIVGIAAWIVAVPIVCLIAYASWETAHMVYPGLENKSGFLRTYDPKMAVMPFIYEMQGYSEPGGIGAEAGTKFVTHFAHFGNYFTIREDRKDPLMAAVNDDVLQRLLIDRARILDHSGAASTGFHFVYATGNTMGSVTIHPLSPEAVHRNMPLPNGLEDVSLNIEVREQWFPNGIPSQSARLLPDSDR